MRSLWSIREILFPINRFVFSLISTIIEKSKAYLRVSKNKKRKKEKILDLHFRLRSENRVKKIFPSLKVKRIYIQYILEEKVGRKKKFAEEVLEKQNIKAKVAGIGGFAYRERELQPFRMIRLARRETSKVTKKYSVERYGIGASNRLSQIEFLVHGARPPQKKKVHPGLSA